MAQAGDKQSGPVAPRTRYTTPQLKKFGSVQANTASGSRGSTENKGNDFQPSKVRL